MENTTLEKVELNNAGFRQKELEEKRTKCHIYTRVMGYFRPVSNFNIGKKSEFYGRKYFKENESNNSKFIGEYSE